MRTRLVMAAIMLSVTFAARADATGTSVTGSLFFGGGTTNYFDPANGFVPAGFENTTGTTVTIGAGIEFGFQDGANTDSANFTGSMLTVTDVDGGVGALPFEMVFTDPAFTTFSQTSGGAEGYTFDFSGDTLKIFYAGTTSAGTFTGTFDYATTPAATPEPSSIALLGTGLLGIAGVVRKRFAKPSTPESPGCDRGFCFARRALEAR